MPDPDEAIVRLLSQHDRGIRAFVLALSGQPGLIDDIVQEVAVVVWRRRHDYDSHQSFGAWARGIARLVTLDSLRRERKRPLAVDSAALDAIESSFAAHEQAGATPDQRLEALERCRERLGAAQRDLLRRRYQDDQSDHAIAEATGRSLAAIHKALVRIRQSLRRCVEQRLGTESR